MNKKIIAMFSVVSTFMFVSLKAQATIISGDLIADPDLPTASLYASGSGDPYPATIWESLDSVHGTRSLGVHSGTENNGGNTKGGFIKSISSLTAGNRYSFMYLAKSLDADRSKNFSFQAGDGVENTLSHVVTLTDEWREYTYTATLDVAKPSLYEWGQSDSYMLIDNIRLYQVSSDTPEGLSSNAVPEPSTYFLLGSGLLGLMSYRRKK